MGAIEDAVLASRKLTPEQARVWGWFAEVGIDPGPAAYDAILGGVGRKGLTADDLIGHYRRLVDIFGSRAFTRAHGQIALIPQGRKLTDTVVRQIRSGEYAEIVARQYQDVRSK